MSDVSSQVRFNRPDLSQYLAGRVPPKEGRNDQGEEGEDQGSQLRLQISVQQCLPKQ